MPRRPPVPKVTPVAIGCGGPQGTPTGPQPGGQHFAPAGRKLLYPGPGETLQLDGPPGVYVVKLLAVRRRLPAAALTAGIPTSEALHALPATDWSETSVSFRVVQ